MAKQNVELYECEALVIRGSVILRPGEQAQPMDARWDAAPVIHLEFEELERLYEVARDLRDP